MHMNRKTALAGIAVLGAGVLALSACTGDTGDNGGTGGNGGDESVELPLVGYTEVAYDDVADGGNLNLSVNSTPTDEGSWNPHAATAQNVDVQDLLAPTLGSLIVLSEDAEWTANPDYAESIELTSEDPQTITVKLNENAVFEDGTPITAADYKATYEANAGSDSGYEVIPSSVYAAISETTVVSDYEFTVEFTNPYADWPALFSTSPLPASIAGDPEVFNTGYVSTPVPSVGPFAFDSIDNEAKIITLKRNENWWGQTPKLESISFKVIAQEAAPQAFTNDELDYIEVQIPDALATAETKAGVTVQRSGGLTWSHVTFNGKAAPFDDVNVRKAVASAIDRELIAEVANAPLGVPATTTGDWIFMPGQNGYEDVFGETYPRDLDAAAGYLEDAGYTQEEEGGPWTKDGEELTFSIIVPAGTQSNITRAIGVQDAMKELGIEVTLDEVASADYFTNVGNGQYQAVTFGWQGTAFPISSSKGTVYPAMEFGDENGYNYSFITDDRLGDLYDRADQELDEDARIAIAQEINEVIASYVPSIPIYPYPEIGIGDEGLVNFGVATFKSTDWTTVGYAK